MPSARALSRCVQRKLESAYARITLNKTTTFFFLLAFAHCLAQGIIQATLFSVDTAYTSLLDSIIDQTVIYTDPVTLAKKNIAPTNFTYLRGDRGNGDFSGFVLKMCDDIPFAGLPSDPCIEVFADGDIPFPEGEAPVPVQLHTMQKYQLRPVYDKINTSLVIGVDILQNERPIRSSPVLTTQCTKVLDYPRQLLNNARREDLSFIFIQFWLFSVSVVAIMYESIPHTLSVLFARALATGWSGYALWRTKHNSKVFETLFIRDNTPCRIDLWDGWSQARVDAEIPDIILNCTALTLSCYLSWTLVKRYNQQSFKCMGPPQAIVKIYRFFMAVLVSLQLGTLFLVAAMGLWTDQMFNTAIGRTSQFIEVYEALIIGTTVLLLPWIALGWYAIRHERKVLMAIFLVIGFVFLGGWSSMFYSRVYAWSLVQWPFLFSMTVCSFVLIVASMILGIICWLNFNKGLSQYLRAEAILASSNFAPSVFKHDPDAVSQASHDLAPSDPEKGAPKANHNPSPSYGSDNPLPTYYLPTLHSYESNASRI
ncbi:hypothetical protein PC9H_011550 [Pleurotus ostreatus]|uniref:Uncharacterized protein n=1 Tax=Pleurotus ostreatus TaxID=5322 RepID=A0A8H7DLK8_PLEOS|nr:uncharacterized protein PC9H_011550 [Pleurotus ostreatus]KAF7421030.1 hypothetical protein PC9H_011550 [Pleurotus ostreatus]KAJ8690528.1 hypothetical protein PTI98_011953 [Pleurotus ostreatus]